MAASTSTAPQLGGTSESPRVQESDTAPPPEEIQTSLLQEPDDVPQCQCTRPWGKNLVVCIDGTSNRYSRYSTNVLKLFEVARNYPKQRAHYLNGVGTEGNVWNRTIDKMVAKTFKERVLEAYKWLVKHYDKQDRIFLFGFSLGAYQARVLSGMIEKVGLLREESDEHTRWAYKLYKHETRNKRNPSAAEITDENDQCAAFKRSLSRPDVRTHFVGVWDTVSSVGLIKGPGLPNSVNGMKHVCAFRHALALDELRVKFLPEYVNGGQGPHGIDVYEKQHTKEVWFAGSHSDVGGLKPQNEDLRSFGPSLRWMKFEAIANGLEVSEEKLSWNSARPTTSMTLGWKFVETLPISRLSYHDPTSLVRWPHLQSPRRIQPHQRIHSSVFEDYISNADYSYTPKALAVPGRIWNNKRSFEEIEPERYGDINDLIRELASYSQGVRLSQQNLDRLISLKNHTYIGHFTILAHPEIAVLLLECLHHELAEWLDRKIKESTEDDRKDEKSAEQRRERKEVKFTPADRKDETWTERLKVLVDILIIFAALQEKALDISEITVEKVCSKLVILDPDREEDFKKIKKLPNRP